MRSWMIERCVVRVIAAAVVFATAASPAGLYVVRDAVSAARADAWDRGPGGGGCSGDNSAAAGGDNSGTTPSTYNDPAPQAEALPRVAGRGSFSAERGRFELPRPLPADRFSKPAHSTTLPPLRRLGVYAPRRGASNR